MTAKLTFNSVNNLTGGPWTAGYAWSPEGFTDATLSSYLVSPVYLTPSTTNLNPFSLTAAGLAISAFSAPVGTDLASLSDRPNIGGMVTTYGHFSQLYGYFEVTAQLPSTTGVASAFWMLPADGSWPPELDVFEIKGGDPTTLVMTAIADQNTSAIDTAVIPNSSTGMHTYALDWEPTTITWYFDNIKLSQTPTPPNMNKPMYLVLDALTVGDTAPTFRDQMKVQSVHAYDSNPNASAAVAATTIADQVITDKTGMGFIYDTNNHNSRIDTFNPFTDVLDFRATAGNFDSLLVTAADDGHTIVENDHNIINLYGVTPDQLNTSNVLFNIDPKTLS